MDATQIRVELAAALGAAVGELPTPALFNAARLVEDAAGRRALALTVAALLGLGAERVRELGGEPRGRHSHALRLRSGHQASGSRWPARANASGRRDSSRG
jgi:hypothetical protein